MIIAHNVFEDWTSVNVVCSEVLVLKNNGKNEDDYF